MSAKLLVWPQEYAASTSRIKRLNTLFFSVFFYDSEMGENVEWEREPTSQALISAKKRREREKRWRLGGEGSGAPAGGKAEQGRRENFRSVKGRVAMCKNWWFDTVSLYLQIHIYMYLPYMKYVRCAEITLNITRTVR